MICSHCNKNEANTHYKKTVNGKQYRRRTQQAKHNAHQNPPQFIFYTTKRAAFYLHTMAIIR